MDRKRKQSLREETVVRFKKSKAVLVAEFRGLTVEEMTKLRVALRQASAEFRVVKNRIAKKAISLEFQELEGLSKSLVGPVGLICSYGSDSAQVTKAALNFEKDHPNFKVTAGHMEGAALNKTQLQSIADLPSKEVLLAQIIGSLVAPHRGLLGVLNGVNRNLVQVINAIKDKKTS
ncbi:MAG: 50S ribosomal protein L10 [Proteobacteria bacterium]|nr:50S ribosomal protein L10 [Pseudomonadota bacterium]